MVLMGDGGWTTEYEIDLLETKYEEAETLTDEAEIELSLLEHKWERS